MILFWATKVRLNLATIEDVPERHLAGVKELLGI